VLQFVLFADVYCAMLVAAVSWRDHLRVDFAMHAERCTVVMVARVSVQHSCLFDIDELIRSWCMVLFVFSLEKLLIEEGFMLCISVSCWVAVLNQVAVTLFAVITFVIVWNCQYHMLMIFLILGSWDWKPGATNSRLPLCAFIREPMQGCWLHPE
jgi:hypothetical protein